MSRYLQIARNAKKSSPAVGWENVAVQPQEAVESHRSPTTDKEVDVIPRLGAEGRELLSAGWRPKESFGGKVIWASPDNRCWYSEEMALELERRR